MILVVTSKSGMGGRYSIGKQAYAMIVYRFSTPR